MKQSTQYSGKEPKTESHVSQLPMGAGEHNSTMEVEDGSGEGGEGGREADEVDSRQSDGSTRL